MHELESKLLVLVPMILLPAAAYEELLGADLLSDWDWQASDKLAILQGKDVEEMQCDEVMKFIGCWLSLIWRTNCINSCCIFATSIRVPTIFAHLPYWKEVVDLSLLVRPRTVVCIAVKTSSHKSLVSSLIERLAGMPLKLRNVQK